MKYALTNRLEEAGFRLWHGIEYCPPSLGCCEITIEEMLEALGDGFGRLDRFYTYGENSKLYWQAQSSERDEHGTSVPGDTPLEALSELWLALNPPQ